MKNIILFSLFIQSSLFAQPLVNVTFRHYPTSTQVVRAFIPGTFNGWGPNSSGFISPGASSQMTFVDSLGFYVKTLSLKSGSEYNYKFHEQYNASGSEWQWFTDPLNPLINFQDNNNSIIRVKKAMIFEISPAFDAIITDPVPRLAAGVFATNGDSILTDQSKVYLDGEFYATFTGHVVPDLSILQLDLAGLSSGTHKIAIELATRSGETAVDSTQFTFVSGKVYFLTPSIDSVWAAEKTVRWHINENASDISSITLQQLNSSPRTIPVQDEMDYAKNVRLSFGENRFVVVVKNRDGTTSLSDTLDLLYHEPQKPQPEIIFAQDGNVINVTGKANDPQNKEAAFLWSEKPLNPEYLSGIDGTADESFQIEKPAVPGDYAFKLVVTDADGYSNSTESFFTINTDFSITIPSLETIPSWVRNADIYCVFIKSLTAKGTLISAIDKLDHIKNMGFSTIWVLPVMDVEGIVDQGTNIGYNIVDFYNVEPAYGSNADFKNFVEEAHKRGLRVILDVTPNHSSRSNPIALDVRSKKKYSRYYDFYQHEPIPHNTNGLGQSVSSDGIVYYSGFSDALLNWNWSDAEARKYMLSVYKYWLREYDIDGFRFDVYWGPHRRYGVENFDHPLRRELRAAKADILLLGETDGTGPGSEENYADAGGGFDMGYDWNLKNTIQNFPSIPALSFRLYNSGYRPGPNSLFLRFLENQDEERVAYRYNSIEKTIPVSTAIFLATGSPLLYQGQEVGMGYKMGGGRDFRVRSTVNWENAPGGILVPHYQKLAQIRTQFPAFRRQMTVPSTAVTAPCNQNCEHPILPFTLLPGPSPTRMGWL
ncbi:MAG: hypothetical protein GWP06_11920 [Actinobacteria bacterium]|nr:hypothetical protein [Actinomycetota bacterium]